MATAIWKLDTRPTSARLTTKASLSYVVVVVAGPLCCTLSFFSCLGGHTRGIWHLIETLSISRLDSISLDRNNPAFCFASRGALRGERKRESKNSHPMSLIGKLVSPICWHTKSLPLPDTDTDCRHYYDYYELEASTLSVGAARNFRSKAETKLSR